MVYKLMKKHFLSFNPHHGINKDLLVLKPLVFPSFLLGPGIVYHLSYVQFDFPGKMVVTVALRTLIFFVVGGLRCGIEHTEVGYTGGGQSRTARISLAKGRWP